MASSSSSPPLLPSTCCYYDVFLSFRGEDTRKNFTDHLYHALVDAGFSTFRDDNGLPRGENIDQELYKAIHDSKCSVIVFSENYADSDSCLYELVTILERKKTSNHIVLPVFYHVEPSDVGNQTGSYGEAFDKHENDFKDDVDKVNKWRKALEEAAALAGLNLKDKHETEFLKEIVSEVAKELRTTTTSITVPSDLVGIHSHLKKINHWLRSESSDDKILLICGIPGIGKTTIAKCVYNSNCKSFKGCAFLEDVTDAKKKSGGILNLQNKLLSGLTKNDEDIKNESEGHRRLQNIVRSRKVMLVLDDVDDVETFDDIIGMEGSFYPGSKIIIITSTRQRSKLVTGKGAYKVHEVKGLGWMDSLKLFCRHAFKQDHPNKDFKHLSEKIVEHCEGHPLALKVLGKASSYWGSTEVWTDKSKALEDTLDGDIVKKLKISIETVDAHVQNLFLDIACFFIKEDKDFVVTLLNECEGFHPPSVGIGALASRFLITIDENNRVGMHNLIRDMGRDIVRQKSLTDCGGRCRLWKSNDSYGVLTRKTGTRTVQGIVLNKCDLSVDKVVLEEDTFREMVELRLLIVSDVELTGSDDSKFGRLFGSGSYKSFPKGLRLLRWRTFPLHYIPDDVVLESLVVLEMPYSNLRQVWKVSKRLPQLKILDLSHSQNLTDTPDFSLLPKLERLILKGCVNLDNVSESIGSLEDLIFLDLAGCKNIRHLPNICDLKQLKTLDISGCSNIFSQFSRSKLKIMGALEVFRADGTPINQWLNSIVKVKSFDNPWPKFLVHLSLRDCKLSDDHFPKDFKSLSSLLDLDLSGNLISKLPDCISDLTGLDNLSLARCDKLQSVVEIPRIVSTLDLTYCTSLKKLTFKIARYTPSREFKVKTVNCNELDEFEHCFKMEPFGSIDERMINILGLGNLLESVQDVNIHFISCYGSRILPIQGIRQRRMYYIYLPGDKIPSTYDYKIYGVNSLAQGIHERLEIHHKHERYSFTLPTLPNNKKIQGLNVSIVYAVQNKPNNIVDLWGIQIYVYNKSKEFWWKYQPSFFGCHVDTGKDMIWFSHLKFMNHFDTGDEVIVSISIPSIDLIILKKFGIQIVYEQDEMMSIVSANTMDNHTDVGSICERWPDYSKVMLSATFTYFPRPLVELAHIFGRYNAVVGEERDEDIPEGSHLDNQWMDEEEEIDDEDISKGSCLDYRWTEEEEEKETDDEAPRMRGQLGPCSSIHSAS